MADLPNGTLSDGNISPKTIPPNNNNTPKITLYFLQCSRSIRIAWLLEALALPYNLRFYERMENGSVPEEFITDVGEGVTIAKAPVLRDGDLVIEESGAIAEYGDALSFSSVEGRFLFCLDWDVYFGLLSCCLE